LTIKGNSGIGDSVYVRVICEHIPEITEVMSDYPEVFEGLPVNVIPHKSNKPANFMRVSYCGDKYRTDTTQWQDIARKAGLQPVPPLTSKWDTKEILSTARPPFCVVIKPYIPMQRNDGFGDDLEIDIENIDEAIKELKNKYYIIQCGKGYKNYNNAEIDYSDKLSLKEYINLLAVADLVISQPGNALPILEAFGRGKGVFVFTKKGERSSSRFIKAINYNKIVEKKDRITWCYDSDSPNIILEKISGIMEKG